MGRSDRPVRGQSLVEFALIAPLALALIVVLIELGVVFSVYIALTNSAREGARAGAIYRYPTPAALFTTPTCNAACHRATVDAARQAAMDAAIMATLGPLVRVSSVDELGTPAQRYRYEATQATDVLRYGDTLTVTLEYTHPLLFRLFGSLSVRLRAQSEMKIEPGGR